MEGLVLLRQAREAGLAVAQEGNTLVIRGPKRAEPIARLLIENKPGVLAALSSVTRGTTPAHTFAETEKERAAIIEYDGRVQRDWAEGFARLDPDYPPADVPLKRWQCFIDDIGRFLDSRFRDVAAALGWSAFDLFGCDRSRPFARIDQMGLCWLINGNRLVDFSSEAAVIETWTGARQTYRRKPTAPGWVLAWELADDLGK